MVLGHELLLEVADDAQELSLGVIIDLLGANLVEQRAKAIVHVLDELGTERQHVGDLQVIQEALVASEQRNDLLANLKRLVTRLLQELGHASTVGQLLLSSLVEVGAELRKASELLIGSEVQTEVTGDLLHGLGLRIATDAGHGDTHVDCRALTLEEELGLQVDLTIGNGNDVGH